MYVVKGVCMQPQSIRLVAVEPTPPESSGPADVSFEIENVGENDRHCVVAVAGLPAAWYALEPHDISLAPGTRAPLRLTVRPPRTALGRYPFTVSARPDDVKVAEALSFTLVVSTGGVARVYPGLVTMRAGTAPTAETTGAAVAARPKIPRFLFLAAPLLLLLLLLGVALSKQPPHATRTAAAPVLSPTAVTLVSSPLVTPVHRAGSDLGAPPSDAVPTSVAVGASGTPRPTMQSEARTVSADGTVAADGSPPTRPVPAATGMARATQATQQSSGAPPTQPVPTYIGQRQSTQADAGQPPSTPVGTARPQVTPVARPTSASVTPPIVSSTSTGARRTTSSKPMRIVAGAVRVHAPSQTHTNGNARRQVTAKQVQRGNTQQHATVHTPAQSRRGQPTRSSYRQAATGRSQARRAGVAPRQGQRRVIQHQTTAQHRQPQSSTRRQQRSAVRRGQQQTSARHTPVNKGSAARAGSALRVTWPAHATLRFDRPDVLRLATEPGASIAVTLQTIIRTHGVDGRELALPYHTTTYAVADRYGRVTIPLRYSYVPTHPTPATLTVVAHTAYGTVRRSTSITLLR